MKIVIIVLLIREMETFCMTLMNILTVMIIVIKSVQIVVAIIKTAVVIMI